MKQEIVTPVKLITTDNADGNQTEQTFDITHAQRILSYKGQHSWKLNDEGYKMVRGIITPIATEQAS